MICFGLVVALASAASCDQMLPTVPLDTIPVPACAASRVLSDWPSPAPCPSAADVFTLNTQLGIRFHQDASAKYGFVCTEAEGSYNLTRLQERTYRTLLFMRDVRFSRAPLPWTWKPLFEWFTHNVKGIRFENLDRTKHLAYCCEPDGVIHVSSGDPEAYEGGFIGGPYEPLLLEAFVHEAAHVRFGAHRCGSGLKDTDLRELGPYAVQYFTEFWVGTYATQLPTAPRALSLYFAEGLRRDHFCGECAVATPGAPEPTRARDYIPF